MAAIRYYPLSRIRTGLYTNNQQYYSKGLPYKGPYYLTYRGEAFTGTSPLTGPNERLYTNQKASLEGARSTAASFGVSPEGPNGQQTPRFYEKVELESTFTKPLKTLKQLTPSKPVVLEDDYRRGYIKRYFVKRIADRGYIMEVDYSDWIIVANKRDPDYEDYEAIEMLWQLTGPLHDTRISQYQIKAGVYDTNKRITEKKAKTFIGLVEFIAGDYTRFAKVDNNVG